MVWQIKENINNKKYIKDLKNKAEVLKKSIVHPEFI